MERWIRGLGIRGLGVCMAMALVWQAASVSAKEEKVPLDKLPAAVKDAIKARFPGAKLGEANKETKKDETVYEVELKQKDQEYEVSITPEGKIIQVEREIDIQELPQAVVRAINKKYPRAELKEAEEVTKGDKITSYEVEFVTSDKKELELNVDPSGKIIEEEFEDDDE